MQEWYDSLAEGDPADFAFVYNCCRHFADGNIHDALGYAAAHDLLEDLGYDPALETIATNELGLDE